MRVVPDTETSRWDTHPAPGERITAMRALPPVHHPADDRPAGVLVPQLGQAGLALQREVVDFGNRTVLPWPDFAGVMDALITLAAVRGGQARRQRSCSAPARVVDEAAARRARLARRRDAGADGALVERHDRGQPRDRKSVV